MRAALTAALACIALAGCSRTAERTGEVRDTTGVPAVTDTTVMDERPSALAGPAIGAGDSLIQANEPQLRPWVEMWRAAQADFRLDSLRFAGRRTFRPQYAWRDTSAEGIAPERNPFRVPAPDGRHVLEIDIYQRVTEAEPGIEIGGDPDSAPALADPKTRGRAILANCGTPCGFHWGAWIDSTRFVVAGWAETDSRAQGYYGTLTVFDLGAHTAADYLVPEVDAEHWTKYHEAWRAWIFERYRALRKASPPA